jgi:hypothetical protein
MLMKVENKVVARFQDGKVLKGYTHGFFSNKEVSLLNAPEIADELQEVHVFSLKALFFVKTFEGNKDHRKSDDPAVLAKLKKTPGFKLKIRFNDGEKMYVLTQGYEPTREGFFVFSAYPESNRERAYLVRQAIQEVASLG